MMIQYSNAQRIETVYTYAEWKRIESRRKARKKAEAIYFLKQKLFGLVAVGFSVFELLAGYNGLIDEGGAFIFLLPIGIYTLVTKEKICTF